MLAEGSRVPSPTRCSPTAHSPLIESAVFFSDMRRRAAGMGVQHSVKKPESDMPRPILQIPRGEAQRSRGEQTLSTALWPGDRGSRQEPGLPPWCLPGTETARGPHGHLLAPGHSPQRAPSKTQTCSSHFLAQICPGPPLAVKAHGLSRVLEAPRDVCPCPTPSRPARPQGQNLVLLCSQPQ